MAKNQQQIRGMEERFSRKKYNCQCQQNDCKEVINPKERYIRMKITEVTPDGYKNHERAISLHCAWWIRFKDFLNPGE